MNCKEWVLPAKRRNLPLNASPGGAPNWKNSPHTLNSAAQPIGGMTQSRSHDCAVNCYSITIGVKESPPRFGLPLQIEDQFFFGPLPGRLAGFSCVRSR